jgi:hypothetical protein
LKKWVNTNESSFGLKPEEEKTIYYTITVPEEAEPGGHYGVVRFASEAPTMVSDTGVGIVGSVAQLVLLKVKGDIKETGKVEEFYTKEVAEGKDTKKKKFFEKGPVGFEIRFKNTGNVHYKPSGIIEISKLFGDKTTLSLVPANVLPDSVRRFETKWENPPAFGYFKAKVKMSYSDMTAESASITFFIIPWKILVLIVLIIAIVGFLIWKQVKLSEKIKELGEKEELLEKQNSKKGQKSRKSHTKSKRHKKGKNIINLKNS